MPYSLVLHCVTANGPLRPEDCQGQKALALFLQEIIEKQDAIIAARLHAPKNSKPFTTAILSRPAIAGHGKRRQRLEEPSEVTLRLTLLEDTLYPLVSQFFLQHLDGIPLLRLGQTPLLVSRVLATPESGEPWAGFASWSDLLATAPAAETSWSVQFATPTSFKTGDADLPLPVPRLCLQSWLNSWDEHAPLPFFPDKATRRAFLADVVEGHVSVSYAHLRLLQHPLYFDGIRTREHGFVGICRFTVPPKKVAPQHRQILATLARYSTYAGTGRKTTMGMGMTRYIEKEQSICQTT
jgi:CRISPR-associated endoribonuclease Cas6